MLGTPIVTAFRNFLRPGLYNIVNIGGLAIGLACAIFIALFLRDELSYDRWIPGSENVYRLELTILRPGRDPIVCSCAPMPAPLAMREHIPEVTAMTRLMPEAKTVAIGDRQFSESIDYVDPGFLQVIRLPLVAGNPATALAQPDSVVISQSEARKYFGDANPLGKVITVSTAPWGLCDPSSPDCIVRSYSVVVSGVLKDLPHNTQLVADLLMPNTSRADTMPDRVRYGWGIIDAWGFVALAPGTDPQPVLAKLKPLVDQNVHPGSQTPGLQPGRGSDFHHYHLTPFREAHLTPVGLYNMKPPGSRDTVYAFAGILGLILLVACSNFTNLMTAQASLRAREISLRKCVGATRRQLIVQFLAESLLMAGAALVIALALVEILLPAFDHFVERPIAFNYLSDWRLFLAVVAVAVLAGLLSGIYPAFVLSQFRPAGILRASGAGRGGSGVMRTILVVAQFAISIGLGISAAAVLDQVRFEQTMNFGFDRHNIVYLYADNSMPVATRQAFASILRANPGIAGVTLSRGNAIPFGTGLATARVHVAGDPRPALIDVTFISPDYAEVYGIKLLAGRDLSVERGEDRFAPDKEGGNDGRSVLINATAAQNLGWTPAQAIGKSFVFDSQLPAGTRVSIVGVLDDAKDHGARQATTPLVYIYRPEDDTAFSVRLRDGNLAATLAFIGDTWRRFEPKSLPEQYKLNDDFDKLFHADQILGALLGGFVCIAVFIACLGLFALAAFTAERRTREIGIRKSFGAGTRNILLQLLWQFILPILLANLIAWPVAYYILTAWLNGFAYRISLSPFYFLGAGGAALLIAAMTVFAHTLHVSRTNPIKALRYE